MAEKKIEDTKQNEDKIIANLYIDLIENHRETFMYYLSENAVLDWFGRTVKGQKNIHIFIKSHIDNVEHQFSNPRSVSKIGFRETHIIKEPIISKVHKVTTEELMEANKSKTPPTLILSHPSSSQFVEKGQGDGLHNCDLSSSPAKKSRLDTESVEGVCISNISMEGSLEFRKKSNKKLQKETKWSRPCKLAFAYTGTNLNDFTLHLIIYEGNSKCRKNLLKDFEGAKPDN